MEVFWLWKELFNQKKDKQKKNMVSSKAFDPNNIEGEEENDLSDERSEEKETVEEGCDPKLILEEPEEKEQKQEQEQ